MCAVCARCASASACAVRSVTMCVCLCIGGGLAASVEYLRRELIPLHKAASMLTPDEVEEYNALVEMYSRRKKQWLSMKKASTA